MKKLALLVSVFCFLLGGISFAHAELDEQTLSGLEFRSLGPGLMSGRISHVAKDPNNTSTWYVAVSSGGVWKTTNAGTTWTPVFDDYGSYSTRIHHD